MWGKKGATHEAAQSTAGLTALRASQGCPLNDPRTPDGTHQFQEHLFFAGLSVFTRSHWCQLSARQNKCWPVGVQAQLNPTLLQTVVS